ncbi:MAG TPA: hypothetical protein VNM34_13385, partial [Verrucomicrobiae bacterium]|nr:hypothetical protein [Verrucomicrobiae bacterium]
MLTQKSSKAGAAPASAPVATTTDPHAAAAPSAARDLESLICYFEGDFVPMRDAKVSIMTHAFM